MTSMAVVSVAGAPGVTTLITAVAATTTAQNPLLVVEAAPAGGVVAARWGWPRSGTTAELAMAGDGHVDLWDAGRPWVEASRVLPGDPSALVMRQAHVGHWLAASLGREQRPVLVDAGRVDGSADHSELLAAVDEVWVLLDPTVAQVTAARAIAGLLNRTGTVGLLVVEQRIGPGRYSADEVAATVDCPAIATIPVDRPSADALCGAVPARRNLRHSPLLRAARELRERLTVSAEVLG